MPHRHQCQRTTPNHSSDSSLTCAQPCCRLQLGSQHSPPKLPPPMDWYPNPTNCLVPGPMWPTIPNCIQAITCFATNALGRQTGRHTDGWRECSMTIGRFRSIDHRGLIILENINTQCYMPKNFKSVLTEITCSDSIKVHPNKIPLE